MESGIWDDWQVVGAGFRRFAGLSDAERQVALAGETLATEVVVRDDLLWGSVFRVVPGVAPEVLAAVFHDYEGQVRYVPGMTEIRVVERRGRRNRVFHRINPVTFVAHGAQARWPASLYAALTYSYSLDEEVFAVDAEEGAGWAIRWTIPVETQVLGARENGEIRFTPHGTGTLVTYNNATEPFGYRGLKAWLPEERLERIYAAFGGLARDYYRRTVDGFVEVARELDDTEIRRDVQRMRACFGR